jgi:large subunit ribosomal protein L17
MRHRNSGRKLGRSSSHRKALFKNMATALLTYGRITTTEAKAKELRGVVEPLIALAQTDSLHARRQAYRLLGSHKLTKRLFDEVAPAFKGVPGGFTRVVKLALPRKGDSAPLALIELTHGEVGKLAAKPAPAAKAPKKAEAAPADGAAAPAAAGEAEKKALARQAAPKDGLKAPKAPKDDSKSSKVAGAKPKSTPRKMEG